MKKQVFLVVLLSSFLLTACNNPSESKAPESSSAPASESSNQSQSSQPASQSQSGSQSSSKSSSSQAAPSGTALNLTAPNNDIHTDLQYSYLKDPDWRNIKAYIPAVNAEDNKISRCRSSANVSITSWGITVGQHSPRGAKSLSTLVL